MADKFSVKFDADIGAAIAKADSINVHKALGRTVRDLANQAKTMAFRTLSKEFNITQKKAKSTLRVPNPKARSVKKGAVHVGLIDFVGRRISLAHFKPRERKVMSRIGLRKAVSVQIRRTGSRKTARTSSEFAGFVGAGRAGAVDGAGAQLVFSRFKAPVYRSRRDRLPAKKLTTKAPSLMLMSSMSAQAMDRVVAENFNKKFGAHLNYYQNIAGRRRR